jgi:protein-S-isoprenylcysteine O-methyltransferase Ste14
MNTSPLAEHVDIPTAVAELRCQADVDSEVRDESRSDLYLDLFERFLVCGFFCWLVARLVADCLSEGHGASLVFLPCEGLVVVFMAIRRRSRNLSRHLGPWLIALGATCAPMLVAPASNQALVPAAWAAVVLLFGLILQVHAKLSLGRSMGVVAAHRGLSLAGPYRLLRHPMYAGYLVGHLAVLALNPSLWNLLVYSVSYALQIPRLLLEERLLSMDPTYRAYQTHVRFRLIPGIF